MLHFSEVDPPVTSPSLGKPLLVALLGLLVGRLGSLGIYQ